MPQALSVYAFAEDRASCVQISIALAGLATFWVLALMVIETIPWLGCVIALLSAGLLARLFIIFHDCCHGSFFTSARINNITGRLLGVLLLTPFGFWRRTHNIHHATSGNLDRRCAGDIQTLTVAEYLARPIYSRITYRLFRHPFVLFVLGPFYQFFIRHRLPIDLPEPRRELIKSILMGNLALAAVIYVLYVSGLQALMVIAGIGLLGMASLAVWVFYIHHQFETTAWYREPHWHFAESALSSSANYHMPALLAWCTGDIGIHHVHHLCPRIPNYRLRQVLEDYPELQTINHVGFIESFAFVRLALWDEDQERLVRFSDI